MNKICTLLFTLMAVLTTAIVLSSLLLQPAQAEAADVQQTQDNTMTDGGRSSSLEASSLEASSLEARALEASVEELQQAMAAGELTAQQLVQFYLRRIAQYDQSDAHLNVVQALNTDALAQAKALDEERAAKGPRSPLHGIVVLVKDNYETLGMATTAGSALFSEHAPARDAYLVARLKSAGAIILGKVNMHEFAYGITTVGSQFGASKNPYDLTRNPGGSSGGTGAAIAANFASVGMGSDTCGSIRIPAAHNNLVGLRGTQGLSSRRGIIPLSSTQDIGGPLARSVQDLAFVLDATVGFDAGDSQTSESFGKIPASYADQLATRPGARIGLLADWLVQESADEAVATVVTKALDHMSEHADWNIQSVPSPAVNTALERPLNGHYVLIHDFKTDINKYLAANPSLGIKNLTNLVADGRVHTDVMPSLQASASMTKEAQAIYLEELAQRSVVRRALLQLMHENQLDALAYPTIRRIAAPLGEEQQGTNCRLSANSGLPAISVPAGFIDGVPVGLELLAEPWSESKLLNLAYTVEQTHPQRTVPNSTP